MNSEKARKLIRNSGGGFHENEWTLREHNIVERFINELYNNGYEITVNLPVDNRPKINISEEIALPNCDYVRKVIIPELIKAIESNCLKTNIRERLGIQ